MAGSYGSPIFNFLRNYHTVLHSSLIILHSYQQHKWVPISLHSHQHLLSFAFRLAYHLSMYTCDLHAISKVFSREA